ncbi:MAG: hypothetical protein ACI9QD_000883 [Thermoproteota archaeon]|jgi:hypothetical protein
MAVYILRLFDSYFYALTHPFQIHDEWIYPVSIRRHKLSLVEVISISWVFQLIRVLILLTLSFYLSTRMDIIHETSRILSYFIPDTKVTGHVFFIISIGLEVIFFPVISYFFAKLWSFLIEFYANLLELDEEEKEVVGDQIMTVSLTSNFFKIIPFVGDVIYQLMSFFLLYAGLRRSLRASRSLSLLIIATPIIALVSISMIIILAVSIIAI